MRILRARYQSGEDFLRHYQPSLPGGGLFYPTREAMPLGDPVILEIRFPGLANKQMIRGFVAWRRAGKHRTKLRAGLGIEFHAAEARTRDLSKGGFCLLARSPLPVGATSQVRLALVFSENQFSEHIALAATVIWSTPFAGAHQIGFKFGALSPESRGYLELFIQFLERDDEGET